MTVQTKPIEVGGGKYRWQYEMSLFRNLSVGRNELYADGADFDFAAEWIRRHVPEDAERKVKG